MLGTRRGIHDVRFHVALYGPDRDRRGGGRVAARSPQYDAWRFAQHLAKADAAARAAAVRRHHRDHGDDLDHARLVSRFRSSHAIAVTSDANFGIKGTLASI